MGTSRLTTRSCWLSVLSASFATSRMPPAAHEAGRRHHSSVVGREEQREEAHAAAGKRRRHRQRIALLLTVMFAVPIASTLALRAAGTSMLAIPAATQRHTRSLPATARAAISPPPRAIIPTVSHLRYTALCLSDLSASARQCLLHLLPLLLPLLPSPPLPPPPPPSPPLSEAEESEEDEDGGRSQNPAMIHSAPAQHGQPGR